MMKRINIHTKKELKDDKPIFTKKISSTKMKEHVFESINFEISEFQWEMIEDFFADYWNNKLGIGGYFYWDEVSSYIYSKVIENKQLISEERIITIIEIMLTKIEKDGGFMED
jgi:hypothetical protein